MEAAPVGPYVVAVLIEGDPGELRASAARLADQPLLTPGWTTALPATGDGDADAALWELHSALSIHGQALACFQQSMSDLLDGYAAGFEAADAPSGPAAAPDARGSGS